MQQMIDWISHELICLEPTDFSILTAYLEEFEIAGIEEHPNGITIYYQDNELGGIIQSHCQSLKLNAKHVINSEPEQNWNSVWESSFKPVSVDDFCVIYAHFHKIDISKFQFPIQITPKMSFGTGHHATTRLMIQLMRRLDFKDKSVLDFGSGTGILSILSKLLGARHVTGIDNMSWAIENSQENAITNNCGHIDFILADNASLPGKHFDVILVNIIRKVIFDNLDVLAKQIVHNGYLILSGYLQNDRQKVLYETTQRGFKLIGEQCEDQWVCQLYQKSASA